MKNKETKKPLRIPFAVVLGGLIMLLTGIWLMPDLSAPFKVFLTGFVSLISGGLWLACRDIANQERIDAPAVEASADKVAASSITGLHGMGAAVIKEISAYTRCGKTLDTYELVLTLRLTDGKSQTLYVPLDALGLAVHNCRLDILTMNDRVTNLEDAVSKDERTKMTNDLAAALIEHYGHTLPNITSEDLRVFSEKFWKGSTYAQHQAAYNLAMDKTEGRSS